MLISKDLSLDTKLIKTTKKLYIISHFIDFLLELLDMIYLETTAGSATAVALGPLAVALIGHDDITYDCWKSVLHDSSTEPSKGMLLNDLVSDQRIKHFRILNDDKKINLELENVWDEKSIGWSCTYNGVTRMLGAGREAMWPAIKKKWPRPWPTVRAAKKRPDD
ncbi:prediced GPI-anchored 23-like [Brachionus plicatilis]|uniref:Prediced GPI-anchored 23-like n=1 Tax=Brachionus plicatilis TaxID=10195 RepID=A0A3M7SKZ3_BRAPC|nr:prediced GPI-anchored 23-like [Brachionus plicatilis]